jgi:hypothetical protein
MAAIPASPMSPVAGIFVGAANAEDDLPAAAEPEDADAWALGRAEESEPPDLNWAQALSPASLDSVGVRVNEVSEVVMGR